MGQFFSTDSEKLYQDLLIKYGFTSFSINNEKFLFERLLKDNKLELINKLKWKNLTTINWDIDNISNFNKMQIPQCATTISFFGAFNKKIDNIIIPKNITELQICDNFNQSIDNFSIPSHIKTMLFESNCNSTLNKIIFPPTLTNLSLMMSRPYSITSIKLPEKLEYFSFYNTLDMDKVIFPKSIKEINCVSDDLKFLENIDLTNILISIPCPSEETLTSLPNNITKLHLIDLETPINNLPIELQELIIDINIIVDTYGNISNNNIPILTNIKIPFGCKIYFNLGNPTTTSFNINSYLIIDQIKKLELTYKYEFINL